MTRFSAENGDRGRVVCDGKEIRDVVEVDTEHGFAIVSERDGNGDFVLDGDKIKTRLALGAMTFIRTVDE